MIKKNSKNHLLKKDRNMLKKLKANLRKDFKIITIKSKLVKIKMVNKIKIKIKNVNLNLLIDTI
jgi:hypothetical protein